MQSQTLTFKETPHIHIPLLAAYWHQHPAHRADLVRYLARLNNDQVTTSCAVHYWCTSNDGKGRLYAYAQGTAAQRLPKHLQVLLYGRTHTEMTSSVPSTRLSAEPPRPCATANKNQYRLSCRRGPSSSMKSSSNGRSVPRLHLPNGFSTLPSMPRQAPCSGTWLSIASNPPEPSPRSRRACEPLPRPSVSENATTNRLHYGPRNRNFFHLKGIEAGYITHIVEGLLQEVPSAHILLLHDGLLVAPLPVQSTLVRLHHEALTKLQLATDDNPFLHLHSSNTRHQTLHSPARPAGRANCGWQHPP